MAGIILWSLVPVAAVWLGVGMIKNAVWTYAIYHGLCLAPAIYWGRNLWLPTLVRPKMMHLVLLVVAAVLFSIVAYGAYEIFGHKLLSNDDVLKLLHDEGFDKTQFWPLSLYAIAINPVFEELFWRGVVLNELDKQNLPWKHFGIFWSSFAYALFHYSIFRMVMFPLWAEIGTFMLALYGAMLAIIYRKTGSIVTTSLAHGLLTDLAVIVLIIDLLNKYPGTL